MPLHLTSHRIEQYQNRREFVASQICYGLCLLFEFEITGARAACLLYLWKMKRKKNYGFESELFVSSWLSLFNCTIIVVVNTRVSRAADNDSQKKRRMKSTVYSCLWLNADIVYDAYVHSKTICTLFFLDRLKSLKPWLKLLASIMSSNKDGVCHRDFNFTAIECRCSFRFYLKNAKYSNCIVSRVHALLPFNNTHWTCVFFLNALHLPEHKSIYQTTKVLVRLRKLRVVYNLIFTSNLIG